MATDIGLANPLYFSAEIHVAPANTDVSGQVFYAAKEFIKSLGWTVGGSGDGTSYNASTDLLTDAATCAITRAWIRFIAPHEDTTGNRQELVFQLVSNIGRTMRTKHSRTDGFTGGSPDATTVPSATDEVIVHGAGTDASPTGTIFHSYQNATFGVDEYGIMYGAGDQDTNAFWITGQEQEPEVQNVDVTAWMVDPITGVGSDQEFPYVLMFAGQNGNGQYGSSLSGNTSSNAFMYHKNNGAGYTFDDVSADQHYTGALIAPASATDTYEDAGPYSMTRVLWARSNTSPTDLDGTKGWSSLLWTLHQSSVTGDPIKNLFDHDGDNNVLIQVGSRYAAPWDGSILTSTNTADFIEAGSAWVQEPGADLSGVGVGGGGPTYRMRGFDQHVSVNDYAYWDSSEVDDDASDYSGSAGPVVDVVLMKVVG